MTDNSTALEPSFADAIKAIAAATDLPAEIRRHWCSSLTGIAKAFDQPPELIPARYSAVRARMAALHHVPMNWTAKTLANHKSTTKAALIWFRKEKDVLPHGVSIVAFMGSASRSADRSEHALSSAAGHAVLLRIRHRTQGGR